MSQKDIETLEKYRPGMKIHGFLLERALPLASMDMAALEFRHPKSGARLLHVAAADPENLFSVAFRTPPPDDTGLPHILEHTVLCGSKRYPVKDPFVELLKTSLATFLNAMTWPDRTVYPCSSMNQKDFHNLMRVYCDAAFFPILSEDHFKQEGHHLEFPPGSRPIIKGVVYNEMRGVYSDPDGILNGHIQHLLFDSNAYGRDYGGDPKAIPSLTYGQFVEFHKTYYHPSNAWIFTYGDVDPAETLKILDEEYLSRFDAIQLDSTISPLSRWREPRAAEFKYPIDGHDSEKAKTDIAIAFATNDIRDSVTTLAMKVIESYLLDNAASPLRKALIDSKLGEELGDSGYASHQRDTYFMVVLKGSEADRADDVELLCLDVVRKECVNGFNKDKVEAALHRLEMQSREIRPQYPLHLMERVFGSWLYDFDPLKNIHIAERLDELREMMQKDDSFLEKLAAIWLFDNPHRLRVTLTPDRDYVEEKEREIASQVDAIVTAMSNTEVKEAEKSAKQLEIMQSRENSPDALATLPRLSKRDVSPDPLPLAYEVAKIDGRDFIEVPMYAGGIGYMALSMQLNGLDDNDIDLLPLFCEALGKTGAAGYDYATMAEKEAASTGTLMFSADLVHHVDGPHKARLRMGAWLEALDSDWERALQILSERLFLAEFDDRDRLRDIILQSRMAWRTQIIPAGNSYAALYASRTLNPALAVSERLAGCSQGRYIDTLAADVDKQLDTLPDRFRALREKIFAGAVATVCQLGSDSSHAASAAWFAENASRFTGSIETVPLAAPVGGGVRAGLAAPADVAYAARSLSAPPLSHPDAPALVLLGTQLSYGYLWNEIRVKGGAYGARAAYDGARGVFNFSSFRDPNIFRTLDAFSGATAFVAKNMDLSPAGLEQSIIGAIKSLDQPMRPSIAVAAALRRHLGGETETFRKEFRARLLSLDAARVRSAAAQVFGGMTDAPVCVLASREKIVEANRTTKEKPLVIESLWEKGE